MEGNYKKWKDRINSKQDVLTEDNVGEFMDLELATKLTPTSGDTVLGRDSLTGKAVEIPTNQLGGNVDTSNLVPYTGANKDVNIGAFYYESSQGFKKTGGTSSQYLMADGSTSTLPTDLIKGTGTLNYFPKFSASGTLTNSLIREEGGRIVVSGGALFQTNADIVIRSISGDNPGDFVFQNTSGQEQGRIYSTNYALIFSAGINPSPKMVVRLNGIGINIPALNPTEWLEVGGYAKATGFKIPSGTATQTLTANGGVFDLNLKADLVGGKVPSSQLPSYVDDVLEYANLASFPATGESGKIYIAIDTNITYRWTGTGYAEISASLALGETASTAYRGDRGKAAYDHSQTTGNPHGTTAADVGASPIGHTHSGEIITPNAVTIAGSYTDAQSETLAIGTIFYNSDQQCYMQKLSADVYHNFGAELPSLSKIGDDTNHLNGMPVYISSGAGNLKIVSLTNSTIGKADAMATQDVANTGNKTGYYCYFGGVNKFPIANVIKSTDDPATWVEGAELRLCNETGKLSTQIEPAPAKCPVVARITAVNGSNISVHFTPNKSFAVEDASNIDGDATSIADTDVILKKEVGGIWKKITFANFKNWFTTELAKKINIGLDTVFNFKNISAMTLTQFKALTPNLETIYFTEEQNATGWQQIKYNGLGISIPATTETKISITDENYLELDSDSTFNLIDVATTKINGIFEKDFVIIKFNAGVVTPSTANQWFKVILKVNNVQTAVSPVFYLTETSGTVEQIAHNFSLNVPAEMVTNGATLHLKTSATMTFNNPAISVVRVHKSTNANL